MKLAIAFAPLLLVGLSIPAQTQAPDPASSWTGPPVVKDAPYFADIITTFERTLPSGEIGKREMRSKIYRDTQGRTRRDTEQVSPTTDRKIVAILIMDPVANTVTSLNPQTMTAHIRDGSDISAPPKQPIRSKPESPAAPTVASSVAEKPAVATSEAEELGTQVIDGLTVKGTKITTHLPPAAGGNEQPRTLVTSTWVSEELQITVLTESSEAPENHRTTTRLTNIVRTEPEAALFEIPSGYAVVDSRSKK